MKVFFDDRQTAHVPGQVVYQGQVRPSRELPERATRLLDGAKAAGCEVAAPEDHGLTPIAAVHTSEYLSFLKTIHARWRAMEDASEQVLPNVHPGDRDRCSYPTSPVGLAGYHQSDMACPIGEHTWESAYWSAQTALSATDEVARGARAAYALCRPPGHHATSDQAGGFCFLNNSGIAAQSLIEMGHRPAILDVDVHHGNGTQAMFYGRGDVLTVSIHGDPSGFYPFFWGHAQERGQGAGLGANLNLPLPMGSGDDEMMAALKTAKERIVSHGTTALVLALGLDAHESDPFRAMTVTTPGFARIGAAVAALELPTVIVQEGGYLSDALGDNLTSALKGFQNG